MRWKGRNHLLINEMPNGAVADPTAEFGGQLPVSAVAADIVRSGRTFIRRSRCVRRCNCKNQTDLISVNERSGDADKTGAGGGIFGKFTEVYAVFFDSNQARRLKHRVKLEDCSIHGNISQVLKFYREFRNFKFVRPRI